LPPTLVDYAEWKKVSAIANAWYHPMSSTTLVNNHIPAEAAQVFRLTIEYLKTQFDLTVSYDSATMKQPVCLYCSFYYSRWSELSDWGTWGLRWVAHWWTHISRPFDFHGLGWAASILRYLWAQVLVTQG
jgi:hypothetical protein